MTADEFREIALSFPKSEERSHMDHPDFRVKGKIFATLTSDLMTGMAKLSPEQQQNFLRMEPMTFYPASGVWGTRGATMITLANAREDAFEDAETIAYLGRKIVARCEASGLSR